MASEIPAGFVDLYSASLRVNIDVNVMGVITDFLPPTRSRGSDWMSTFSIADHTSGYGEGQKVRFFRPQESELPKIQGTGDVIMLWNVKLKEWSGMRIMLSGHASTWAVFPQQSIPAVMSSQSPMKSVKERKAPEPKLAELKYAVTLCNSRDRGGYSAPVPQTSCKGSPSETAVPSLSVIPKQKFSLIKDMECDRFYDLVGQVVRIYPNLSCTELYITDYTQNGLLYNHEWGRDDDDASRDGDEYGYAPRVKKKWRGPYGKKTLTVTLWPPHAYWAQTNVKEDDFVFLRNVRAKFSADQKLEGVLHSDRKYPDRVDVTILHSKDDSDDRVKDVLRRKREYIKQFKDQSKEFVDDVRGQKRKGDDDGEPLTKNQLKKRRKQERELAKTTKSVANGPPEGIKTNDESPGISSLRAARNELNTHIISTHTHIPTRPLSSILDTSKTHAYTTPAGHPCTLPFQNTCSRATVRVVDFFPRSLADFAVRSHFNEFDALSDDEEESDVSNSDDSSTSSTASSADTEAEVEGSQTRESKWEWRFCLLVEDAVPGPAKEKVKVYVANEDAEFLLKLDAENLHAAPTALAQLREKLFILWGDLEERRSKSGALQEKNPNAIRGVEEGTRGMEVPRAKPFQCCLKEYGVKVHGKWERRFRMFGTTIS